jgi:hypothetical protein
MCLPVVGAAVGPRQLSLEEIRRLNFFLSAGGGWRAAAMDYWGCRRLLDEILGLTHGASPSVYSIENEAK